MRAKHCLQISWCDIYLHPNFSMVVATYGKVV